MNGAGKEKENRMPESSSEEDTLLETIYQKMRRLVYRMLGPHEGMEDVVQTAMETFLKARKDHRGDGSIEAFASGIAVNVVRGFMRKQRRGIMLRQMVARQEAWPELPPDPADQADSREKLRRLLEILKRLKPDLRTAYLLYQVEGKTVPEIARMEGTSESSVRTRILRARRDLHRRAAGDPMLAEWLAKSGGGEEK